jgi:phage baseplate assembly protein W
MKGLNIASNPIKISSDAELVASRLERLIFTPQGSVLGFPEFGSTIPFLMQDPIEIGLAREILREVEDLIVANEKDIVLESLDVVLDTINDQGNEEGVLNIKIGFYMKNVENPEQAFEAEFFRIAQLR